jgi:hypothetical protein
MDYYTTRTNVEKIIHTALRQEHGAAAIVERPIRGMTLTVDAPADYVAGIGAAQDIARVARSLASDYARKARGEGIPWRDLAAALGLSADPDDAPAESAFEIVAPAPSMPFDAVSVCWECASCGQWITDKGPYNGHPEDDEIGHAGNCARHAAEVAAVRRAWGDD